MAAVQPELSPCPQSVHGWGNRPRWAAHCAVWRWCVGARKVSRCWQDDPTQHGSLGTYTASRPARLAVSFGIHRRLLYCLLGSCSVFWSKHSYMHQIDFYELLCITIVSVLVSYIVNTCLMFNNVTTPFRCCTISPMCIWEQATSLELVVSLN